MRTKSYEWQDAKRSRGGTTASIRNAVRRAILFVLAQSVWLGRHIAEAGDASKES